MDSEAKVTGIGGIFFKARDPRSLAAWYAKVLGVPVETGNNYATFSVSGADCRGGPVQSVWSTFPDDTKYFDPGPATFMINYRVADLDAMLDRLRLAGTTVDDKVEESEFGRFGWAIDPEGNRFELWQPPVAGVSGSSPESDPGESPV